MNWRTGYDTGETANTEDGNGPPFGPARDLNSRRLVRARPGRPARVQWTTRGKDLLATVQRRRPIVVRGCEPACNYYDSSDGGAIWSSLASLAGRPRGTFGIYGYSVRRSVRLAGTVVATSGRPSVFVTLYGALVLADTPSGPSAQALYAASW